LQNHLQQTLAFLEALPPTEVGVLFEITQIAAVMLAGMQTCDEAVKALDEGNLLMVERCKQELAMLHNLLCEATERLTPIWGGH
jgi:hypothetical protein